MTTREEWKNTALESVAAVDAETIRAAPGDLIDYISLEDVNSGTILSTSRLRYAEAPSRARRRLRSGDVLFGTVRPNLRSHAQFKGGLPNPVASTGFAVIRARPGKSTPGFLAQWVLGDAVAKQVERLIAGSNYPAVSGQDVRQFQICLPDVSGQEAIAGALSDVDDVIAALELTIAKKQAIKQGMMQQLLIGKTRLPGFSRDWEVTKLGAVASMGSGGTPLSSVAKYYGGSIPWVSISDMTRRGKYIAQTESTLTEEGLASSAAKRYEPNVVLYAMYASVGECSLAVGRLTSSQAILGIKTGPRLDREFLYYWLQYLKPQVKLLGQQGTQANLNAGTVRDFDLRLPQIDEQMAIGSALADVDTELSTLERRLVKAHDIKTGMMQGLLTGRTRLPAEGAAA